MPSNIEVELKGGMYTFMSLKLHTHDLDIIDRKLAEKVQQAPGFFKDTPVVVDISLLDGVSDSDPEGEAADPLDTVALMKCIRSHHLVPIVASVSNKSSRLASAIELPLIESSVRRQKSDNDGASASKRDASGGSATASEPSATDVTTAGAASDIRDARPDVDLSLTGSEVEYVVKTPLLVTRPVRSGQQVYAKGTDLIVMGPIGPGAEVIADNNIHVYGPLRGRALCGVSGNTDTRIFCQSLEAELVSVAGNFRVLEEIPEDLRGKPAQIWLDKEKLNIEPL